MRSWSVMIPAMRPLFMRRAASVRLRDISVATSNTDLPEGQREGPEDKAIAVRCSSKRAAGNDALELKSKKHKQNKTRRRAWYGIAWRGMVWHGMLCYVMLCYVMLCCVVLCCVVLCYVMLCYVMVWYGMVWYGMVWYGTMWQW